MRKYLIALVALASLATLSACGSSGGSDGASDATTTTKAKATKTTTEVPTVTVAKWAGEFCGNFKTWQDEIQASSSKVKDKVDPTDASTAQTAISDLFSEASTSTQDLIASIENGSVPDMDEGQAFLDDLISKFQEIDDAAQSAKTDVGKLKTDDLETFETEATKLVTQFQDAITKVGDSFSEIDAKYPSADLEAALSKSCAS